MIFDDKVDLKRKSRLVIGGHIVDSYGHEVYVFTMKYFSARILMTITAAKKKEVMTGDIGNAYLNANNEENIYTGACAEFKLVVIMSQGNLLE